MAIKNILRALAISAPLALTLGGIGCAVDVDDVEDENIGESQDAITDVSQTAVERQSIGNCWLYAEASWVEALNLAYLEAHANTGTAAAHTCEHLLCDEGANLSRGCMPAETEHAACVAIVCDEDSYCCDTGWDDICVRHVTEEGWCGEEQTAVDAMCATPESEAPEAVAELDVSQSYWTYWHWFEQVTGYMWDDEISTGGHTHTAHGIVRDRGVMSEENFVPEDGNGEMSNRQSTALNKINAELEDGGKLATRDARRNGQLVREVFDDAWGLSDEVRAQLDEVFGADGEVTLRSGASVEGTNIIDASEIPVRYAEMVNGEVQYKDTNLVNATKQFRTANYPTSGSSQRQYQQRIQRALHASQPMVVTWDVDFNAMENGHNERRGGFNMETLAGNPGRQGGHQTVLHDYKAKLADGTILEAGVTLDPENAEDAAKLEAALEDSTEILLLRTKNSWGAARPDRAFAEGFPGYHDLWMDYLNGPIDWCPSVDNKTDDNCRGETTPLNSVLFPPGF